MHTLRLAGITAALFALPPLALARAQLPPQPTDLAVVHRSGQTFLTWTERPDLVDESYRIYRVAGAGPIANVTGLSPMFEVWEGSSEMFADRTRLTESRYVKRCVIVDDGPELATDTGVFVVTLAAADFGGGSSGTGAYAVTTVDAAGVENPVTVVGTGGNASAGIAESIADPQPVRVAFDPANPNHPYARVFIQYLDSRKVNTTFFAPNPINGWWGENPQSPRIQNAHQYACTYRVSVPPSPPPGALPIVLELHAHYGNRSPADYSLPSYGPAGASVPLDAIEIAPIDVNDTWWFGFATKQHDYRQGGVPSAGKIANYTEARVLRMVWDVIRDPGFLGIPNVTHVADPQRVYVFGHSMGGSGALAFAMRYGNVFAAAHASKPMTDYAAYANDPNVNYAQELKDRWGEPGGLFTQFSGPNGWADHLQPYSGTTNRVYRWQNHQLQLTQLTALSMAPCGIVHGLNDQVIPGATQCDPAYDDVLAAGQTFGALVNCSGHGGAAFTGLAPTIASVAGPAGNVPFRGLAVVKNESVPGLSNLVVLSGPGVCVPPSTCLSCPCGGCAGLTYLHDVEWAASWNAWAPAPVDTATPPRWEISLRTTNAATVYRVDVTARRLQQFQPAGQYSWWNVQNNTVVESGQVTANAAGVLTVPAFLVTSAGNRLVVF